jgi:CubicO group peptidase (beta-lactamase class C family)
VRKVAGTPLAMFAKQRIFDPLGMTDTFILEDEAQSRCMAQAATDEVAAPLVAPLRVDRTILLVRGERVILDSDLAELYSRRTNVRMISIFTAMARGLRRTLESIATPCSVKA